MSYWKGKKVLVTGGTGFIGSYLSEELIKKKAIVTVTYKSNNSNKMFSSNKIKKIKCDLTKRSECIKVIKNQDYVICLAAKVAGAEFKIKHPATMLKENLLIHLNTLEAIEKNKIPNVVFVSSVLVYPRKVKGKLNENFSEEGNPDNSGGGYGWSKKFGEVLTEKFAEENGINYGIARLFNLHGANDNFNPESAHIVPKLIYKSFNSKDKEIIALPENVKLSFCYITDIVNGILLISEKGLNKGPINIGSEEEISLYELGQKINQKTGNKLKIIKSNNQILSKKIPDLKKAKKILGFKPKIKIDKGLNYIIDWYVKNKNQIPYAKKF